jgi:hypothetical protein
MVAPPLAAADTSTRFRLLGHRRAGACAAPAEAQHARRPCQAIQQFNVRCIAAASPLWLRRSNQAAS